MANKYINFYASLEAEEARKRNNAILENSKVNNREAESRELHETYAKAVTENRNLLQFKSKIRDSLVTEAILAIYNSSFGNKILYENEEIIKRGLCSKFVQEHNSVTLLNNFRTTSVMLSEYALIIDKYIDLLHEDCKKKKECKIDDKLKSDFYDEIIEVDNKDVGMAIKSKVADAIAEYNDKNLEDKMDLENAAELAQQKINTAKTKELKEHYQIEGKKAENKIRNRPKGIYESMVTGLLTSWYNEDSVREAYTTKDGNADIDKMEESCELLYAFVETLNTAKICNIDEKFITDLLS